MNTMNIIHAYRLPDNRTLWCFDDAQFGLVREPFMHGASNFITALVGAECERVELVFSVNFFPGANCLLTRPGSGENVKVEGCTYVARSPILKNPDDPGEKVIEMGGVWLCPAMTHYLGDEVAPEFIYGQISATS